MRVSLRALWVVGLVWGVVGSRALAQTEGGARLEVTLRDYNGSGSAHWTVAWVTTQSGAFIKTLWKQGTRYSFSSSQWTTHCPDWNRARGGPNGSTLVDGYTSATAASYTGTNSPVILTWNCHDTNDVLVADGDYRFWVQYAENSGAGPVTAGGLLWTKGPSVGTKTYPNQGANFADMRVTWTPSNIPVNITAARTEGGAFTMQGTGPGGRVYHILSSDNLTLPVSQWTPIATNFTAIGGGFSFTNAVETGSSQRFYQLRLP